MKFIKSKEFNIDEPCAVSLGKFDGLHAGHMTLIERIIKSGYSSAAFTFDFSIYNISGKNGVLFTDAERAAAFEAAGVDYLIEYPFDDSLRNMTPREFFGMLASRINLKLIVAGEDFRFGKDRTGDAGTLKELADEFKCKAEILSHLKVGGERISSTRVIRCIETGNVAEAAKLLAYPYFLSGKIVHGRHLGTSLGFPTANIECDAEKILPSYGVYGVCAQIEGIPGKLAGICNVGTRPTVNSDKVPDAEVYLLDFAGDIYGKNMKIEFISHIRDEMKFNSTDDLRRQMIKDVECVRAL